MLRKACVVMTAALVVCLATPGAAQQQDTSQIAQLRRQLDALSREIEAMKLGEDVVVRADTSSYGLGPAASKVYRAKPGVSLGGYGEVMYQNFFVDEAEPAVPSGEEAEENAARDQIDAVRLITYVGYKFTPKLLFNSEIEFEHASTEYGGSVSVEFAYIDWVASPKLGVRAGMLLVPMGFINELHEPPVFLGTRRPLTETAIIPSTWRENGAGVFGEFSGLSYRAYMINGLDAVGGRFEEAPGFSAGGLRGGRQGGSEALLATPSLVARVDYTRPSIPALTLGGSAFYGNSGQDFETTSGQELEAPTTVLEAHAQYKASGLELRGLWAMANVGDAALINQVHGFIGDESVGSRLNGWYLQGGYDLLRGSTQQLIPYVRYERVNTQAEVPAGFLASAENNRTVTTFGAMWKPITNIAVKSDFAIKSPKVGEETKQLNISLGYLF